MRMSSKRLLGYVLLLWFPMLFVLALIGLLIFTFGLLKTIVTASVFVFVLFSLIKGSDLLSES